MQWVTQYNDMKELLFLSNWLLSNNNQSQSFFIPHVLKQVEIQEWYIKLSTVIIVYIYAYIIMGSNCWLH